ncbi:hypothetical protein BH09BAC3_BH09BAC3_24500 [soil metagenome]
MRLIREPKNVDLIIKSEPWTKDKLKQFREIMKKQRERKAKLKLRVTKRSRTKARTPNILSNRRNPSQKPRSKTTFFPGFCSI